VTVAQWILLVEVSGTLVTIALRLVGREPVTWRYAFAVIWPLVLLIAAVSGVAWLVGRKFMGDEHWDKPAGRAEEACSVCGGELVAFDELERRARAAIDGKSDDVAADCRLFAPIVLDFVRKHRWDQEARPG
jgi:hypothetical protein